MVSHASPFDKSSPAPKRPISERKLAANRANAKRSPGPRTAEGKARSRLNATKHGLRAKLPPDGVPAFGLIDDEDPTAYREIRQALYDDVRPRGALEELVVERIARAAWRMRRADAAEVGLFDLAELDRVTDSKQRELDHLKALDALDAANERWNRMPPTPVAKAPSPDASEETGSSASTAPLHPSSAQSIPRTPSRVEEWLIKHREETDLPDDFSRNTPAIAAAEQFRKSERECELLRLTGYLTRIEGSFRAAIRELRQLRKERVKWEESDNDANDSANNFDAPERPDHDRNQPLAPSRTKSCDALSPTNGDCVAPVEGPATPDGATNVFADRASASAKPQAAGTNDPTVAAPPLSPQPPIPSPVSTSTPLPSSSVPRANDPTAGATDRPARGKIPRILRTP